MEIEEVAAFGGKLLGKDLFLVIEGKTPGGNPEDTNVAVWEVRASGRLELGSGSGLPDALTKANHFSANFSAFFILGGDSENNVQFNISAAFTLTAGTDDISGKPTIEISGIADVSYPFHATSTTKASVSATIRNLGGKKGLSVGDATFVVILYGPGRTAGDPEITFSGAIADASIGGINVDSVSVTASGYSLSQDAAEELAALGISDAGSRYWTGTIKADISIGGQSASGGLIFNTLTNEVTVTAEIRIETDSFVINLRGEKSNTCLARGESYYGSLTFKNSSSLPFGIDIGDWKASVVRYCKPDSPIEMKAVVALAREPPGLRNVGASVIKYPDGTVDIQAHGEIIINAGPDMPKIIPQSASILFDFSKSRDGKSNISLTGRASWESPGFAMHAYLAFSTPCVSPIEANATLDIDNWGIRVSGASVTANMACEGSSKGDVVASLNASVEEVKVGALTVQDVSIDLSAHQLGESYSGGLSTGDVYFVGFISGSITFASGGDGMDGLIVSGGVSFDTIVQEAVGEFTVSYKQTFGKLGFELEGSASMKFGLGGNEDACGKLGDFSVSGRVALIGTPLGDIEGHGSFVSDCGDRYILEVALSLEKLDPKLMTIGGRRVNLPKEGGIRFDKSSPGEIEFSMFISLPHDVGRFSLGFINSKVNSVGFQFSDCNLCRAIGSLISVVPFVNVEDMCVLLRKIPMLSWLAKLFERISFRRFDVRFERDLPGRGGKEGSFTAYGMAVGVKLAEGILLDIGYSVTGGEDGHKLVFASLNFDHDELKARVPSGLEMDPEMSKILQKQLEMFKSMKSFTILWSSKPILSMEDSPEADIFTPHIVSNLFDLDSGVTFLTEMNLLAGGSPESESLLESTEASGQISDGEMGDSLGGQVSTDNIESSTLQTTVGAKMCMFYPVKLGGSRKDSPELQPGLRFTSFKPGVCIAPKALELVISIGQELTMYEGKPKDSKAVLKTLMMKQEFRLGIDEKGISIRAFGAARLKGDDQMLANPFGGFKQGGIIFPVGLGVGVKIFFAGAVSIETLELELGFFMCAGSVKRGGSQLGATPLPINAAGDEESVSLDRNSASLGESSPPLQKGQLEVPNMPQGLQCVGDPYGSEPLIIKVAFGLDLVRAAIALKAEIRNFSIGRLLLSVFSGGILRTAILAFRPIFDLIKFKTLIVSFNSMPYPYRTYAGTLIPAGLDVMVEDMIFFKFIKVKRATFSAGSTGFSMEIFVDPIVLKVAGITLLEIKGIQGIEKTNAFESIELAKAAKADREKMEAEAHRKEVLAQANKFVPAFCDDGNLTCNTCAHSPEKSTLVIACGSGSDGDFVISEIADVQWDVPKLDSDIEVGLSFISNACVPHSLSSILSERNV